MGDCENRCGLRGLRELPVSQRGPSKGSVHRQVKFPTRSTHVPPFRHGPEPHSSTSGAAEKGLGCSQPLAPSHPPALWPWGALTCLAGLARVASWAHAHCRAALLLALAAVLTPLGSTWRLYCK